MFNAITEATKINPMTMQTKMEALFILRLF